MSLLANIRNALGSCWHVNQEAFYATLLPPTDGQVGDDQVVTTDANGNVLGLGSLSQVLGIGATKTLGVANAGDTFAFDTAAGSVATLPAATGSGAVFKFFVKTLATSNSHIIYCNLANGGGGTDVFEGLISGTRVDSGNAVLGFATASTSNTITLNRTTTGSVSLGEWIELEDVESGVWNVKGFLSATGAAFATPFSHT